MLRIMIVGSLLFICLTGCGQARFSSQTSQSKATNEADGALNQGATDQASGNLNQGLTNDAAGVLGQPNMCACPCKQAGNGGSAGGTSGGKNGDEGAGNIKQPREDDEDDAGGNVKQPVGDIAGGKLPQPSPNPANGNLPQPSPNPANGNLPQTGGDTAAGNLPQPSPDPAGGKLPQPAPNPAPAQLPQLSPIEEYINFLSTNPARAQVIADRNRCFVSYDQGAGKPLAMAPAIELCIADTSALIPYTASGLNPRLDVVGSFVCVRDISLLANPNLFLKAKIGKCRSISTIDTGVTNY